MKSLKNASLFAALALPLLHCSADAPTAPEATEDAIVDADRTGRAVDAYLDAWMGGVKEDALLAVLAPSFVFESGGARVDGAAAYVKLLLAGGGEVTCDKSGITSRVVRARAARVEYVCKTPAGPVPFSEELEVAGGRVTRSRAVFDGARVAEATATKATVMRVATGWTRGDAVALRPLFTPNARFHGGGRELSLDAYLGAARDAKAAMPDFDLRYRFVEATRDGAVVFETRTGTHSGAPYFGLQASGRRIGHTAVQIFRLEGGKIAEVWTEAGFDQVITQLTGRAPAPTQAAMNAALDAADATAAADCPVTASGWPAEETRRRWVTALGAGPDALGALYGDRFRLSSPFTLAGTRADAVGAVAGAKSLGTGFDPSGLVVRYAGSRVVGVAGAVKLDYQNPTGAFGLPALAEPRPVAIHEAHVLVACGGKITRQYSHNDALGLHAQLDGR